jgi:hypothetical protein
MTGTGGAGRRGRAPPHDGTYRSPGSTTTDPTGRYRVPGTGTGIPGTTGDRHPGRGHDGNRRDGHDGNGRDGPPRRARARAPVADGPCGAGLAPEPRFRTLTRSRRASSRGSRSGCRSRTPAGQAAGGAHPSGIRTTSPRGSLDPRARFPGPLLQPACSPDPQRPAAGRLACTTAACTDGPSSSWSERRHCSARALRNAATTLTRPRSASRG